MEIKAYKEVFIIFSQTSLVVEFCENQKMKFLNQAKLSDYGLKKENSFELKSIGITRYLGIYIEDPASELIEANWVTMREIYRHMDSKEIGIAGYALQNYFWDLKTVYCGQCKTLLQKNPQDSGKNCSNCSNIYYPQVSPAIIVGVIKDDKILLGLNSRHVKKRSFSVLAGFVDQQESLEDCVRREVFEEVGIKVKNIRYFGSQPWPFPDSLMIGFFAQYDSGEITPDNIEILEADWYDKDNLPVTPEVISIAGKMIEWFKNNTLYP